MRFPSHFFCSSLLRRLLLLFFALTFCASYCGSKYSISEETELSSYMVRFDSRDLEEALKKVASISESNRGIGNLAAVLEGVTDGTFLVSADLLKLGLEEGFKLLEKNHEKIEDVNELRFITGTIQNYYSHLINGDLPIVTETRAPRQPLGDLKGEWCKELVPTHEPPVCECPEFKPEFAVPVTIGLTNQEGVLKTLVRSDHIHAHGDQPGGTLHELATDTVAGFMSPEDKQKVHPPVELKFGEENLELTNFPCDKQELSLRMDPAFDEVTIQNQGLLKLEDSSGGDFIGVRAPSDVGSGYTLTLPADDGDDKEVLKTDGSGNTDWATISDIVNWGMPVTVGITNQMGSANTFSHSDHVHAHGNQPGGSLHALATDTVAGFMSPEDKQKVHPPLTLGMGEDNLQLDVTNQVLGLRMDPTFNEVTIQTEGSLKLEDDSGNTVSLKAPFGPVTDYTLTFPEDNGSPDMDLILMNSAGDGVLSWAKAGEDGQWIRQHGNIFGEDVVIGSNDAFGLQFETNNTTRVTISASSSVRIHPGNVLLADGGIDVTDATGPSGTDTLNIGASFADIINIGTATSTQTINIGTEDGLDTVNIATGGTTAKTVNIGTGAAITTINLGGVGDTVTIAGTLTTVNTTNTEVSDKLMSLNAGNVAGTGFDVGFQIEEGAGIYTGYFKTNGTRDGWLLKAPAGSGHLELENGGQLRFEESGGGNHVGFVAPALTADTIWTLPNADGTLDQALVTDGAGNLSWLDVQPAVTWGMPVTIGTTNQLGSGTEFAHHNHVHAHGDQPGGSLHALATDTVAGFMSPSDKQKVHPELTLESGEANLNLDVTNQVIGLRLDPTFNGVTIQNQGALALEDTTSGDSVRLSAPDVVTSGYDLYFPSSQGASNKVLMNDGVGNLSWENFQPIVFEAPETIGTSNTEGTKTTFSRADHIHAHGNQPGGSLHALVVASGSAGFMSGSDKQKLDDATSLNTPTTLVMRDGAGSFAAKNITLEGQGLLKLEDSSGGDFIGVRAPANVGSGYTLTLPADDGDDKEVLKTDGSGNTDWAAIHDLITWDYPYEISDNTIDSGILNTFSHSDHVHSHGQRGGGNLHDTALPSADAGFMSGSDKQKLDDATSLNNPTTLVMRDGAGSFAAKNITLEGQGLLKLEDSSGGEFIGVRAPANVGSGYTLTLPADYGNDKEVLKTDGSGNTDWAAISGLVNWGMPVAVGTTNQMGSADTFSHSDHVHAHGNQPGGSLHALATDTVAGFMSPEDKQKVHPPLTLGMGEDNLQLDVTNQVLGLRMDPTFNEVTIQTEGSLKLEDDSGNTVSLKAPFGPVTDYTLTFPEDNGSPDMDLILMNSAGDGVLSWAKAGEDGQWIRQHGNIFGEDVVIGSNDAFGLQFETNNTTRVTISASSSVRIHPGNVLLADGGIDVTDATGPSGTDTLNIGASFADIINIGTATSTQTINIGTEDGLDTVNIATGGTTAKTVNIGTGAAITTINLGGVGDTVTIAGTLTTVNTTNTEVSDKLMSLNAGNVAGTGFDVGFQIEEGAGIYTGYFKTNGTRDGWLLKAPAGSGHLELENGGQLRFEESGGGNHVGFVAPALTADTIWTLPNADGTLDQALVTDGAGNLSWLDVQPAVTWGMPVTIGTTNQLGSGTEFAHHNHVHAHGDQPGGSLHALATDTVAGFMSPSDKQKVHPELTLESGEANLNLDVTNQVIGLRLDPTFNGVTIQNQGALALEDTTSGDSVRLSAPDVVTSGYDLYFPSSQGASNKVLMNDGVGNLSWENFQPIVFEAPETIGTSNTEGTKTTFSRADHIHAHGNQPGGSLHALVVASGSAGFMSGSDKQKLDDATSSATPSTLVMRDGSADFKTHSISLELVGTQGQLYLKDSGGTKYVGLQAPTVVTTSHTIKLPPADGTGALGERLVTDGAGNWSWYTPSPTALGYIAQDGNSYGTRVRIGTNDTYPLVLETNDTPRVEIDTSGNWHLNDGAELRLKESSSFGTNYAGFRAPNLTGLSADLMWTLPRDLGSNGDIMTRYDGWNTNGLAWTPSGPSNVNWALVQRDGSGNFAASNIHLEGQGELRLEDGGGGQYIALRAPTDVGSGWTMTLPQNDGDSGQVLTTDGNGVTSWTDCCNGGSLSCVCPVQGGCKVGVYLSGNDQYIGSNPEVVEFNNELFDPSNSFNPITHEFTAPISGYYSVSVNVSLNQTYNCVRYLYLQKKTGGSWPSLSTKMNGYTLRWDANDDDTKTLSCIIHLNYGNKLRVVYDGKSYDKILRNYSSLFITPLVCCECDECED